jgi:hypothetical protein
VKPILTFCLIPLLFFLKPANAQISTEVNLSSKRSGIGLDVFHHLDAQKKWSIYTHNLVVFHYKDNTTGFLTFSKLSYTFKSGFGLSANLIGNIYRFYPGIGLHYDKKINHLSLFFLTTYALHHNSFNENFLIIGYKYPFTKKINIISQNEFYTSLRSWSLDRSDERIKLGIELNKTQIGVFNESAQNGGKFNLKTINFGWYLKYIF